MDSKNCTGGENNNIIYSYKVTEMQIEYNYEDYYWNLDILKKIYILFNELK